MPRSRIETGAWTGLAAGKVTMFSIRNVGGVSLLLFGTTFLWLTPMFAGVDVDTSGVAWAEVGFLAAVTIIGFTVATWGLFRRCHADPPLAAAQAVRRRLPPGYSRISTTL